MNMKEIKLSFACPVCKQENILICYEEVLKIAFAILECPKCHKKFKGEFSVLRAGRNHQTGKKVVKYVF